MSLKQIMFCGNDFIEVDLPDETRVLTAPIHDDILENPRQAVLNAIRNPIAHKPLKFLVRQGSRVLIAFDDMAVPVPPMAPNIDNRQWVIETVVEELYAAGVRKKDITLVCAVGLHRKWRRTEIASFLGNKIMKEFSIGQIINHDAEDKENLVHLGLTENGYDVEVNRRLVESDLTVYVNINWVPFNGGWKSTMVGLGTYNVIRHIHNNEIYLDEKGVSCMEPKRNLLHGRIDEIGRHFSQYMETRGKNKVFQIETCVNNELPANFCWIAAGDVEKVHVQTLAYLTANKYIDVKGQADILIFGLPDFMPYSMGTIINPILLARMGLGYLFSVYSQFPVVKEGGILILANPCLDQCDPIHHPSYVEFWNEAFKRTRDADELYDLFAEDYANRPEFIHKYRFGYGFHGVHPVQAYCTTSPPKKYISKVFVGGCTNHKVAEKLEWEPFESVELAVKEARNQLGKNASITFMNLPPFFIPRVEK